MLLENEKIDFNREVLMKREYSDEEINNKYIDGEVRIVTEQARYPLDTIPAMLNSGKYKLDPDYQRRRRWSNEKMSRLIESFIMNVPIPPIFLYEDEFSHYEVMDGLQRLTTIKDYYEDKYALEGLTLWSELNGKKYSELPEKVRMGIDRRYISSIVLLQESAKNSKEALRMKQMVFERINSGGVKLEPQETRNALYNGKMNQKCIKLSENEYLRMFLGISDDKKEDNDYYKKMTDVEYVLRFFAMRQLEGYAGKRLYEFLDEYLIKSNNFSDVLLEQMGNIFDETIKLAYDLLGEKAFKMYRVRKTRDESENWNWYNRTTTTIYDPLMQVLANNLHRKEQLIQKKEMIADKIANFYMENYENFEGRNSNKADVEKRVYLFQNFFDEIIGE